VEISLNLLNTRGRINLAVESVRAIAQIMLAIAPKRRGSGSIEMRATNNRRRFRLVKSGA
jgi:hypothetical protein